MPVLLVDIDKYTSSPNLTLVHDKLKNKVVPQQKCRFVSSTSHTKVTILRLCMCVCAESTSVFSPFFCVMPESGCQKHWAGKHLCEIRQSLPTYTYKDCRININMHKQVVVVGGSPRNSNENVQLDFKDLKAIVKHICETHRDAHQEKIRFCCQFSWDTCWVLPTCLFWGFQIIFHWVTWPTCHKAFTFEKGRGWYRTEISWILSILNRCIQSLVFGWNTKYIFPYIPPFSCL